MISGSDVRKKYLDFFAARGHVVIPSAPLVPENDPTTLFTSSGMQPLVPNLLGQPHPSGTKLVDSQKCIRTQDIEEVGDNRHTTFFEMLGNWSLGEYFKQDQLKYFFTFLTDKTEGLGLDPNRLSVSVFEGNSSVPKDTESIEIWKSLGIPEERIFAYPAKKNWWSRSGEPEKMPAGEPGGPDSEVFYEFTQVQHDPAFGKKCHPNCDCGRFLEIGNSVFMQYQKQADGSLKELPQKNVDFGGGLERLTAAANDDPDVFKTDLFWPIIEEIESLSAKKYEEFSDKFRMIADHTKASIFLILDGITPSNQKQGYVLRRLLRRSFVLLATLKDQNVNELLNENYRLESLIKIISNCYKNPYSNIHENLIEISRVIHEEWDKFGENMRTSYPEIMKLMNRKDATITGDEAFYLFESKGILPSVLEEVAKRFNKSVNWDQFKDLQQQHQELSRSASKGMFKGGLQDQSEITTRYHTATHLLHASLRKILGDHVQQKGSNITADRLRFDFSHDTKLTDSQIQEVEDLVNQKISEDLPVTKVEMKKSEALSQGALAFFPEKYPDVTNVYSIGDFSKELCGGPHVNSTGIIGKIKITREESAGAGIRRIYATALPQKEN